MLFEIGHSVATELQYSVKWEHFKYYIFQTFERMQLFLEEFHTSCTKMGPENTLFLLLKPTLLAQIFATFHRLSNFNQLKTKCCHVTSLKLVLLPQDRATALRDPFQYKKTLSVTKQRIYLLLYWLLSLAAPAVVAAGIITSWPFPDRYSCQVSHLHLVPFWESYFTSQDSQQGLRKLKSSFVSFANLLSPIFVSLEV